MNPIKKVTDPQNIRAKDIPSSSDANPAGEIGGVDGWRRETDGAGE